MRKAKISGAAAWWAECPACGGGVTTEDGSYMHGIHDTSSVVTCEECCLKLAPPNRPKKIPWFIDL
jgi:hypothetical protein